MKALMNDQKYIVRVAAQIISPYFNYIGALEGIFPVDKFTIEHPEFSLWFYAQMDKVPFKGFNVCFM